MSWQEIKEKLPLSLVSAIFVSVHELIGDKTIDVST